MNPYIRKHLNPLKMIDLVRNWGRRKDWMTDIDGWILYTP
jgi:hypothetical protein